MYSILSISYIPSITLSCLFVKSHFLILIPLLVFYILLYYFILFHLISRIFFLCWFLSISSASLLFSSFYSLSGFPFSYLLFRLLFLLLLRFLLLPFPFPIFLFLRCLYPLFVFIFTRFSSLFSQLLPSASSSLLLASPALLSPLPPPPSPLFPLLL